MRWSARSTSRRRMLVARRGDSPHEAGPIQIELLRVAHDFENLIFDTPVATRLRACERSEPHDAVVWSQLTKARFDWLRLATRRQHADASVQPRKIRSPRCKHVGARDRRQRLLAIACRQRLQGIARQLVGIT